jgi:uncharacterized repeat protein (TIGR03803 family)
MNTLFARSERWLAFALLLGLVVVASPTAHSQTYSILHTFAWTDGANPAAGLIVDGLNLYGTTSSGGTFGAGTVFRINGDGEETVLYDFKGGGDGADPEAALLLIGGNLYGTTSAGGGSGSGTVFEVAPNGEEKILYSFSGYADGSGPQSALVADSSGNLYGTTALGGKNAGGTVFELVRPRLGDAVWTEKVLYSFGKGNDGVDPFAGVALDATGNLYGTTSSGGAYGNGTVFQLTPSPFGWSERILYSFQLQADGGVPYAGIVVQNGNLYGAATDGGQGGEIGGGTVFELTPSNSGWNFNVLYRLAGWGISGSYQNLLVSPGKIYATTHCDGANGEGTVYELTPSANAWTGASLHEFAGGSDGVFSFSNLVLSNGVLYGTTKYGGANYGIVFKVVLPDDPSASPLLNPSRQ